MRECIERKIQSTCSGDARIPVLISYKNILTSRLLESILPSMKIIMPKLECKRCGYSWMPRKEDVRICPRCKSARFDQEKNKMNKVNKNN